MSGGVLTPTAQNSLLEVPRPAISVILPTFNEAANITILIDRITRALAGHAYEIIVVDDNSPDLTWQVVEAAARHDHRLTLIRRTSERGLSSAVLTGMAAARGSALVAMDADLQHDERRIPQLAAAVNHGGADVSLGSRAAEGGGYGEFGRRRRVASWAGAALARLVLQVPVSDPMSGFFAVGRDRYELIEAQVNPRGFKIMLEFLARGPKPAIVEVGYVFGERVNGATKLNSAVVWQYLRALLSLGRASRTRR